MSIIYNVAKDEYIQKVDCAEIQGVVSTASVPITLLDTDVEFIKAPDNICVEKGDTIPYTLTLKNTSDVTLTKIEMIDVLPVGISLVPGTLKVNGGSFVGDIQTGITLTNKLLPGGQLVVSFSGLVETIPPTTYYNTASATYYYQVSSTSGQRSSTVKSNTVLAKATPCNCTASLVATKTANVTQVQKGDAIIYQITIKNTGSQTVANLSLIDLLDTNLRLSPNSITIDGAPVTGSLRNLPIGNLPAGASTTIAFMAIVVGGCPGSTILNQASILCTNSNCSTNTLQTNQVSISVVKGGGKPCPPDPPDPPCPPEPPYPPCPDKECKIERVITPIYLPNYMNCIKQITDISGFIKSVKTVSYGCYTKLLVTYVVKVEYMNSCGLYYTYQQCEEVYLDVTQCGPNISVEIQSIEEPCTIESRYIEVITNMKICM